MTYMRLRVLIPSTSEIHSSNERTSARLAVVTTQPPEPGRTLRGIIMSRAGGGFPADIDIPDALWNDPAFHSSAPDAFVCPLTLRVMRNPAIVRETGRTYERVALTAWMSLNGGTEPMDRRVGGGGDGGVGLGVSSNVGIYVLIQRYVETCRALPKGALASDGTVGERIRRAAARTTVVVVETAAANAAPQKLNVVGSDPFTGCPRIRPKTVDPCLDVVSIDCPDADEPQDGKWFRFDPKQLADITGLGVDEWGGGEKGGYNKRGIIKGGEGASFGVTGKRKDSVIVFQHRESGLGVGCLNPCDYAASGDWVVGERIPLSAYSSENLPPPYTFPIPIEEYACHTQTGWNLPGAYIRFGQCGLVGHYWKELEVEFKISSDAYGARIFGLHTDTDYENVPFTVFALRSDGEWHPVELHDASHPWGKAFKSIMDDVSSVRVRWEHTDLFKVPGSTARSGGGLHATLLGATTTVSVLDVRRHGHPSDGSIFRFDVDAMRVLNGDDWKGEYDALNLRTGRKGKVVFTDASGAANAMKKYTGGGVQNQPMVPSAPSAPPPSTETPPPPPESRPRRVRRSPGPFSCCFNAPEEEEEEIETTNTVCTMMPPDDPAYTTVVVYADSAASAAAPTPPAAAQQDAASLDALGVGYWSSSPMEADDWRIGDIVMLGRSGLDIDVDAPSVLEDDPNAANVPQLETQRSLDAAGDWAFVLFPERVKDGEQELFKLPDI
jgi:hypothetical protein